MPRPRITEFEVPRFEEAIISFQGYTSLEKVPRILFARVAQVIDQQRIPMDKACDVISGILKVTREEVRRKLSASRPASQPGIITTTPRTAAWPSLPSIYRQNRG